LHSVNATANGVARVVKADLVSGNFYNQMQLHPQVGRQIEPADEDAPGAGTVAVLSDGFWHSALGGEASVIGKTITVNMTPFTIVGVNPPAFTGPDGVQSTSPELFLPLSMINIVNPMNGEKDLLSSSKLWWLQLMARCKPASAPSPGLRLIRFPART